MKEDFTQMKVEHVMVDNAIEYSPHRHAYVNPYNGCPMNCPFCYWLDDPAWENRLQVRDNIHEVLEKELAGWNPDERIYLGSVCDPFCNEEYESKLTLRCLELLSAYKMPVLLTTSATNNIVKEYLPMLKAMKNRLVVVVELGRLPFIQAMQRGKIHPGIENANLLYRSDIHTWATYAPIIPGVSNLEQVLKKLEDGIPVYIEELKCKAGSVQAMRVEEWVKENVPEAYLHVKETIEYNDYTYYNRLLDFYRNNERVRRFPFRL